MDLLLLTDGHEFSLLYSPHDEFSLFLLFLLFFLSVGFVQGFGTEMFVKVQLLIDQKKGDSGRASRKWYSND